MVYINNKGYLKLGSKKKIQSERTRFKIIVKNEYQYWQIRPNEY